MSARIALFILIAFSALLIGRGVVRSASWAAAWTKPPPLTHLRHRDATFGPFHRLMDWVDETVPPDKRVTLIGPARDQWFGERATFYKIFRYRLQPRPTRPAKDATDRLALIRWADVIVTYGMPPLPVPAGFAVIDAPGGEGRLYRRVDTP